jgi:YVTN family beta-propeller protein
VLSPAAAPGADLYSVTATLRVDAIPQDIEVNPVTNRVYVACSHARKLLVIDGDTQKVIQKVSVTFQPVGVAVDTSRNRVYVSDDGGHRLAVIDGKTHQVLTTRTYGSESRPAPISDQAWRVAVNPATDRVFLACHGARAVFVIDGTSLRVLGQLDRPNPPELRPVGLGVNPAERIIFVTYQGSHQLFVYDELTYAAMYAVPTTRGPTLVQQPGVNPLTNQVYLAGYEADTVFVIGGATRRFPHRLVARTPVPGSPMGVAVDDASNLVCVSGFRGSSVAVIDGNTFATLARVPTGRRPAGIAVNPRTGRIYVATSEAGADRVSVIAFSSPRHAVQCLMERVNGLVVREMLPPFEGSALAATLREVIEPLERGERQAASQRIHAFIAQVETFSRRQLLSQVHETALTNAARLALTRVEELTVPPTRGGPSRPAGTVRD